MKPFLIILASVWLTLAALDRWYNEVNNRLDRLEIITGIQPMEAPIK